MIMVDGSAVCAETGPSGRTAIVVGAGIGGLTAAVGLRRIGWTVTVCERAPVLGEVGAGLSLWPNAERALTALGLGDVLTERSVPAVSRGNMWTASGRALRRAHPTDTRVRMVHRADLHDLLRADLPESWLKTGAKVTGVTDGPEGATVTYEDANGAEQTLSADLVIAADGIDSAVRASRWPTAEGPRFRGRSVWRGITPPGSVWPIEEGLMLARGQQFGLMPLPGERVYWFLTANAPGPGVRYDDDLAELRRRLVDWHEPVRALLDATDAAHVLHHDLVDLPPLSTYVGDRIVLLGDAAHAMTPDLGQGACQAIEDAVVLASTLAADDDLASALAAYEQARRGRTQAVAKAARDLSERNRAGGPLQVPMLGLLIRFMPPAAWSRMTAAWADWQPPAVPSSVEK